MTADSESRLGVETARVSQLLRAHELSTPAVGLGRWKVRDIAAHLGGVHRWATRIVSTRSQAGPSFTKSKLDGTELCDWFDEGITELLAVFANNDVDAACPNFNPGSAKTVGWWLRRQLHETTVHRWDVERALGCVSQIDDAVAADGVDEFLDVFVRTRGKQTLASTLVLHEAQGQSWTLQPAKKPGRIDVLAGADANAPVTVVSGSSGQLLLALWGRLTISETDLVVTGDGHVAASLFAL